MGPTPGTENKDVQGQTQCAILCPLHARTGVREAAPQPAGVCGSMSTHCGPSMHRFASDLEFDMSSAYSQRLPGKGLKSPGT